jgi:Zn-dependent peptidase ImmA (M78 family)
LYQKTFKDVNPESVEIFSTTVRVLCSEEDDDTLESHGAIGLTRLEDSSIIIHSKVSIETAMVTFLHEYAHILCHIMHRTKTKISIEEFCDAFSHGAMSLYKQNFSFFSKVFNLYDKQLQCNSGTADD